jgi:hypothetical protein
MKIIKILIICTSISALFFSCVKDDGNYNYSAINDVQISGIEANYIATMLDSFKITPVLSRALTATETDLEYSWTIYNASTTFNFPDTLAKTRNLKILVNSIPGSYKISYNVFDKNTGVRYRYEFNVVVTSELQRGFLALSELNGKANVTFIGVNGKVYQDIYDNINGEAVGTNPVSITYTYQAPIDYVAILCNDARGGVYISSTSFKKLYDFKDFFYDNLTITNPQAFVVQEYYGSVSDYQASGSRLFLTANNKLYYRDANYLTTIDGVSTRIETKFYNAFPGDYEISPVSFQALGRELFYDNKYKKFMYIADYTKPNLMVPAANLTGVFNPASVGLDFVWGKLTISARNTFNCNSIFKDGSGNYFYLKFDMTNKAAITPLKKVAIPAGFKIREAKTFAGNALQDYIYFAVGSKVYVFDCILNQEREIYDFGTGKSVDNIRWHEAVLSSRIMHVCTSTVGSTGRTGSIYEMNVATDGMLSIKNAYTNVCGKVVSTHWKN